MRSNAGPLVSEADFLALPVSLDKVELVDGEVVVSPSPGLWRLELVGRVVFALRLWASRTERGVTVAQSPLDVRFATGRILQPDAMVFLVGLPLDHEGPIDRVPEVCVEVVSTNAEYDRVTKRHLYSEAGVREYWLIEPAGTLERWHQPGLRDVEVVGATLRSPLLPGFELDLA